VLRHKPETIGIKLDKNGWTEVDILLTKLNENGNDINLTELISIVDGNDKQRFAFNDDITKIRANQGHSLKVDLKLIAERPPIELYHGTVERFTIDIRKVGLNKMNRQHVHLSDEIETATKVANRRGKAIILTIDSASMNADGVKFYKSKNGVWLTDKVLPKYIK
jgi:putative RNA 2'-phosphotransferase